MNFQSKIAPIREANFHKTLFRGFLRTKIPERSTKFLKREKQMDFSHGSTHLCEGFNGRRGSEGTGSDGTGSDGQAVTGRHRLWLIVL